MQANLIQEFSEDHEKTMEKLNKISDATDKRNVARIRELAEELDELLGPHFLFEEDHLYPATEKFLGEDRVEELMEAHGPVAPALAELKELEELSPKDAERIRDDLTTFYVHVSDCEGTTVIVDSLPDERKKELARKLIDYRDSVGKLTSLRGESEEDSDG